MGSQVLYKPRFSGTTLFWEIKFGNFEGKDKKYKHEFLDFKGSIGSVGSSW